MSGFLDLAGVFDIDWTDDGPTFQIRLTFADREFPRHLESFYRGSDISKSRQAID